jgi:hypothetical protein
MQFGIIVELAGKQSMACGNKPAISVRRSRQILV